MKENASAPPIEAVIFDLGNVLIQLDIERGTEATARAVGLPAAEVRRRLQACGELLDFELGLISERDFHGCISRTLGQDLPFATFHELWNGIFTHEIAATVELVGTLRARPGLKVGLLSNTNVTHFEFLRRRMAVLREMEHLYVSHELGCRKPDPRSYRMVLEKMAVRPERAVFVDDLEENIAGARSAGMHAVHATGPEAVRQGLARLGLIGNATV